MKTVYEKFGLEAGYQDFIASPPRIPIRPRQRRTTAP